MYSEMREEARDHACQHIQKLRCRTCYEALRFAPHIEAMGKLLVDRMRSLGPYIPLHLRYEKDMLAFSGCTHDLSPDEADELRKIRYKFKQLRLNFLFLSSMVSTHLQYKLKVSGGCDCSKIISSGMCHSALSQV